MEGTRRRIGRLLAGALGLGLAGCGSGRSASSAEWRPVPWGISDRAPAALDPAPRLALAESDRADAGAALVRREERRARTEAVVAACHPERHDVREVANAVAACFRAGARDAGRALVRGHPRVVTWDAPEGLAVVECRFAGDALQVDVLRGPLAGDGPVAVVVPPGTYGAAEEAALPDESGGEDLAAGPDGWTTPEEERRFGRWPAVQDLALLRAPVILLERGVGRRVVEVPIACASFSRAAPEVGRRYRLASMPEGSPIDRLLVALCAEPGLPDEAEAQLAVWLARDDIDWAAFCAEGGDRGRIVTFGAQVSIRAHHAQGAARLLLGAGIEPSTRHFFGGTSAAPEPEPAPAEPEPAQPPADEAPAPPAPEESPEARRLS